MLQSPRPQEMEDKEAIKRHYNQIANKSISERKLARNIKIRNVHNFIKSCFFKNYIAPMSTVLDLGIGKGGDLKKYQNVGIKELYGVDIANRSIIDAIERAREMNPEFKVVLKTRDCYTQELDFKRKFDVVSAQFTFHYCFASEDNVDTALNNIVRHLVRGGYVLMTMPCKKEILRRRKACTLSNKFYKIEFKDPGSDQVYGNAYRFSLVDSVNECVEYLVDMDELTRKMCLRGLELVEDTPFEEFYNSNLILHKGLHSRMKIKALSKDEREVMTLHHAVVYRLPNTPHGLDEEPCEAASHAKQC